MKYLILILGCYTWDETHGSCRDAGVNTIGTPCDSSSSCVPGSEYWTVDSAP